MPVIENATRDTQLFVQTLASALACASSNDFAVLLVEVEREPSPVAQRVKVLETLDSTLNDLDALLRSKKAPPAGVARATLGRRLASRGEVYDAVQRTYTPGPGFDALLAGLASTALDSAGVVSTDLDAQNGVSA